MECKECDGTGTIEIMNCHNYSNDCCGGCYKESHCKNCEGTGINPRWQGIEESIIELLENWELTKEELKELINKVYTGV